MQGDLKMHLEKKEESEEMWKEMLLGAQLRCTLGTSCSMAEAYTSEETAAQR